MIAVSELRCFFCDGIMKLEDGQTGYKHLRCRCGQSFDVSHGYLSFGPMCWLPPAVQYWNEDILQQWVRWSMFQIEGALLLGQTTPSQAAVNMDKVGKEAMRLRQEWAARRASRGPIKRFFCWLFGKE